MMLRPVYLVLLGILSCSFAMHCPRQKTSPGREIVCYTSVSDIGKLKESLCRCTTLVHQGHDVRNLSTSDFEDLRKSLKEVNPAIQFMLSLEDPAKILRTSALVRQEATARIVRILKEVDGVELNVTAGSKDRLFQFVKGLRDELVKKSYDKRLFLVLPTKAEILAKQFVLKDLAKYVDLFTVATHYLVEDDEAYHTFHPSRLMGIFDMINTDSLIDFISGLGAPRRKILVSVPSSGYRFTLADKNENAPRSPTSEKEPVVIDRKELCDSMNKGEWTIERDEDLTAPYAFKNTTWLAFEDNISIGIKGKYVLLREMPGIAVYDIENDLKTDCSKPVTHEIHHSFTDFKRKSRAAVLNALEDDLHQSQITYPNHVKSSDFRVVRVVDTEGHIRVVRENTQTEFTCSRQGYFVHPKSCNRFYRCVKFNQEVEDYSVFEFDCPAGLAFDERTEVCVWPGSLPEGSPCPGSSEIAPVTRTRFQCPAQPGYYADPQNPRWFFACMDLGGHELTAYEFRCPYGLVFDEHELVCEWPWLVQGYTGTEHTKTEYDYKGHSGGSSTQGTGGYVTGGIPDGFSRPPSTFGHQGAGGYGDASIGANGYSGAGSVGGHGSGSGFSGASGVGYGGSTGIHAGSAGRGGESGYSGGAGAGHAGSSGYGGESGYSGGAGAGHAGSSGYGGESGYSGGAGVGHAGSSGYGGGSEYSGGAGAGHAGSSGYGGGSEYSGGAGAGHAGSSGYGGGSEYSGGAGAGHAGSSGYGGGSEYSGGAGAGHAGSSGYGGGSGYSGGAGGGHAGSSGYGGGSGYSGGAGAGHTVSTGTDTGSVGHDYSQVTNTGYAGSTVDSHAGSDASLYSGASGTRYSGSTGTHTSSIGHGYSGTSNTGYTGPTVDSHAGTDASTYSGAGGSGYTGSAGHNFESNSGGTHYGSSDHGYSQTTGTHAGGSGYSTSGSHTYSGSSGTNGYSGAGDASHGTTTGTGYSGSTGTVYTGQHAGTGSIGSGYVGVNADGYQITTASGHQGTQYSGTGSTIYNGAHGNGYSQSSGANQGSSHAGGGYLAPGRPTGNAGHGEGGYTGSSGVSKSAHGAGNSFNGFTSSVGYTGTTGTQYESSGYPGDDTGNSQVPIYSIPGLGSYGQPTGTTIIKPGQDIPSVNYLPSTPSIGGHSGALPSYPSGGQGFITGHGTVDGTFYHGQSDFSHTYSGSTETTDGYITKGVQSGSYGGVLNANGQNVTLGFGVPGIGTSIHGGSNYGFNGVPQLGGTGTIITGDTIHGSIATGDSSSGTVLTRGDIAGTVLTGSSDQGTIVTGSSHPGYSKTGADTPGYVISNGVKTTYSGGVRPGTLIHGTAVPGISLSGPSVPGIAIKGQPTPGILLTGQTAPGVSLGGSIEHGTVVGTTNTQYSSDTGYTTYHSSNGHGKTDSTTYVGTAKTGTVYTGRTPSYETNEYHDNGGRGTIRFNNGFVTTKYAESDIPDYRPAGGTIPESVLPGGVDQSGIRVASTPATGRPTQGPNYSIGKSDTPVPSGFTKTGPTKTGITTAQLGGRGSYVISSGQPKPTINPEHIGAKAFEGNVVGYTKTSSETNVNQGTYSTTVSTQSYDTSHIDTSKITLGPSMSTGYSYPKPKIPFVTGGLTNSPSPTASLTDQGHVAGTTPASYLNIEVYNNPTLVDSAPITASPAVVNTYSYNKPADDQYQGAVGRVPTEFNYRKPATPTAIPTVTYTSGPVDNYKTTAFEAARIPVAVSTAQPVIDTGYKTVVSPTVIPVTLRQDQFGVRTQSSGSQSKFGTDTSYEQGGYGDRNSYVSVTSPSPSTVISPISVPNVRYQEPSIILQPQPNYVHSTASTGSGYSYDSSKSTLSNIGTSTVIGSRPQTQYIPADVSPAIGVTYRKPFPVPGITYQQSTSEPEGSGAYGHTGSSDRTSVSSSYSKVNYPSGSNTRNEGSPTNLDIPRDEVGKLITNYDRGTVKYTPTAYDTYTGTGGPTVISGSSINDEFSRKQTSAGETYVSTSPPQYGRTPPPPAITTYSGGYTRPSSVTAAYEVTTKPTTAVGKGKVIVKWSDLHPLLLGKLGAECTCRGDPFANLRGPGKKLIDSSRGKVDLSNYDESEIYVDLEKESGSYEDSDYATTYDSSPSGPLKVMNPAGISMDRKTSNTDSQFGKPSTSYLPSIPSTALPAAHGNPFLSGRGYELRGTTAGSVKGKVPANGYVPPSGHRAGKTLNIEPTETTVGKAGAGFDRYGPGGLRGFEETLEGVADCARPGLFRHPNFCNKFYACHWDQWKKRFTLHVFNCPVHLTFDSSAGACNWPSKGPACQDDNLLV